MSCYIKKKDHDRDWDYDRRCDRDYKKDCGCDRKKDYGCAKDKDCAKCETLSPCPKKILLECGTTGGMMTFTATGQTFNAANLTVDTSCFCKPEIKLQFSSQVNAMLDPTAGLFNGTTVVQTQADAEVVLLYELVCRRNGGSEITIGSWTFRRFLTGGSITSAAAEVTAVDAQDLTTSDTFSFDKCICSSPCQGCVDYMVRVTATTISTVGTNGTNNATATVSMGQLAAKIQEC
ncbi:DUF4489 domain-containing protein [Wukongibacter baidiensis]|uniref:DUF4489 domain-containing protein n=1 Tax=Wukongibacter baidiensis TaxID=1723361 RepID=UPI003D7F9BE6